MTRRLFGARMAMRTLLRSRGHAALILATIAVPILVATAATTVVFSLQLSPVRAFESHAGPAAAAWVDAYQRPGLVQSPHGLVQADSGGGPDAEPPALDEYEAVLAQTLGPGSTSHRLLLSSARWAATDGRYRDGGYLFETELSVPDVAAAFPLASGRAPLAPGEVLVDQSLADDLGIDVGDSLLATAPPGFADGEQLLPPTSVEVVGVIAAIPGATDRNAVVGLPGTALTVPSSVQGGASARWIVVGEPVTWETVQAINGLGSAVWSRDVLINPPPPDQVAFPDPVETLTGDDQAVAWILLVAGVGLAALLVAPAFAVGARRIRHEMGLLIAIGARGRDLRRVVLYQGVAAGVAGVAVGVAGGLGIAAAIRAAAHATGSVAMPDVRVMWVAVTLCAVIGVLAPTLAAWWPARQAAREDPVAALAGRRLESGPRRQRRTWVAGLVAALGLVICVAGVAQASSPVLAAGAFVSLVGVLLLLGTIVQLAARLAPRLRTAGRYALRDANRRRSRTVPAVAGVLAAVALAVGVAAFATAYDAHVAANHRPPSGPGTVRVSVADVVATELGIAALPEAQWDALEDTLAQQLPLDAEALPVYLGFATGAADGFVWMEPLATTDEPYPASQSSRNHLASWTPQVSPNNPLIDDGTLMSRIQIPGADQAAAALAEGRVVVDWSGWVADDGTATFAMDNGGEQLEVTVPATAVDLGRGTFRFIVPPQLAGDFGLEAVQTGLVATTGSLPSVDAENDARAALDAVVPGVAVTVERGIQTEASLYVFVLTLAGALIAIAAAGTCVALAAADAKPDLATLAAVGASTKVRRTIAAAQGAVIVTLGVGLGSLLGMAFAAAMVAARRFAGADEVVGVDTSWSLHVPWPVLGLLVVLVPAVAVGGAWLLTPATLPMTRRLRA